MLREPSCQALVPCDHLPCHLPYHPLLTDPPAHPPPALPPSPAAVDAFGTEALRTELHILNILHSTGCGSRVVKPLATVRWPGEWLENAPADRWFQVNLLPAAA
jgi:hypothetical protein